MSQAERYDVVIAGGGMVGVSLALCLAAELAGESRILLVESFPLPQRDPDFETGYSPSFDARSTALSYSSYLIYERLGLWSQLQARACPIETIHVSEKGRFGSTLMHATDYDWPALGFVIENAWLGNILIQALYQQPRIEILSPARVESAMPTDSGVTLSLGEDARQLKAALLVVADGAESSLRDALGVEVERRDYGQHAVIANIGHDRDHQGRAFERFTATGPLALLPLHPAADGGARSALVWTLPPEEAGDLQQCPEAEFLARLQAHFGYRLGRLRQAGERHCYPLALVQACEQVRSGVVVMGNAAHSLHPVAGQGFNLALRDVARLAGILGNAEESLGELAVLQQYMDSQSIDQELTVGFSDRLPGLFMHRDPALGLLRDIGLFALDLSPALKREFVRHTAGVAAISRS